MNYRYDNIIKLPRPEKSEVLIFIVKIKNSFNHEPDKSEIHEIMREKQNDEKLKISELRTYRLSKIVFRVCGYTYLTTPKINYSLITKSLVIPRL